MQTKLYPIGTICTLRNNHNKVMIISYKQNYFINELKVFDYVACSYPEGLLTGNTYYFNNDMIETINYIGYESDEYKLFCQKLDNGNIKQNSLQNKVLESQNISEQPFSFDENGIVISDNRRVNVEKQNVINPFIPSYINNESNNNQKENWSIFKNIKFNEKGIVVEAELNK